MLLLLVIIIKYLSHIRIVRITVNRIGKRVKHHVGVVEHRIVQNTKVALKVHWSGTTLPHIQAILLNVSRPQILYWQECMWMPVTSRISCNLTGCLINYRGTRRNTITKEHIIKVLLVH